MFILFKDNHINILSKYLFYLKKSNNILFSLNQTIIMIKINDDDKRYSLIFHINKKKTHHMLSNYFSPSKSFFILFLSF